MTLAFSDPYYYLKRVICFKCILLNEIFLLNVTSRTLGYKISYSSVFFELFDPILFTLQLNKRIKSSVSADCICNSDCNCFDSSPECNASIDSPEPSAWKKSIRCLCIMNLKKEIFITKTYYPFGKKSMHFLDKSYLRGGGIKKVRDY